MAPCSTFHAAAGAAALAAAGFAAHGQSIVRVNVATGGAQALGGPSAHPAISADGRHVAFLGRANNLVPGASGYQVYAHDRDPDANGVFDEGNGVTTLISIGIDGLPGNGSQGGFNGSNGVAISGTGRFVAWMSQSTNLVAGDTTTLPHYDIFVRDRDPGGNGVYDEADAVTTRVSVGPGGAEADAPDNGTTGVAISADGRYVLFDSSAMNLVGPPGDMHFNADIFRHDRMTGLNEIVSYTSGGSQGPDAWGERTPVLSGDGRHAVFMSGTAFEPGDANMVNDYYARQIATAATHRVSVGSGGLEGLMGVPPYANDFGPAISHDGRFFAFSSFAPNLVPSDSNGSQDVFLSDRDPDGDGFYSPGGNLTFRVSVSSAGGQGTGQSLHPAISGDGRFVAFSSFANDLVPGDTCCMDVFIHDRIMHRTQRVNMTHDGSPMTGLSGPSALSYDGRYVAFVSTATNLVPGDTNGVPDIFVRDMGPVPCPADWDASGAVNSTDISAFLSAWLAASAAQTLVADFNTDGVVNSSDISAFLTAWLAAATGGC